MPDFPASEVELGIAARSGRDLPEQVDLRPRERILHHANTT